MLGEAAVNNDNLSLKKKLEIAITVFMGTRETEAIVLFTKIN